METAPVSALEIRRVDAASAARARRWCAWVLELAGVEQDTADAVVLAVSELVTNVYLHTDSPRALVSVELVDASVRLVVHDDAQPADWQQPGGLDEHGRGLILVRALAADFHVDRHQHGTTITALIPHGTGV